MMLFVLFVIENHAWFNKGYADEKIKNKGIRSNEMCACRDRRSRFGSVTKRLLRS